MPQYCPLCRKELPVVDRFPYYLCRDCKGLLTDREGNSIEYYFAANPYGYKGQYRNNPGRAYLYDLCYIGNEEFRVFSDGKNECFIQPVNFTKYATRVGRISDLPSDPTGINPGKKKVLISENNLSARQRNIFLVFPILLFFTLLFFISESKLSERNAMLVFCVGNFALITIFFRFKFIRVSHHLKRFFSDLPSYILVYLIFFFLGLFSLGLCQIFFK